MCGDVGSASRLDDRNQYSVAVSQSIDRPRADRPPLNEPVSDLVGSVLPCMDSVGLKFDW